MSTRRARRASMFTAAAGLAGGALLVQAAAQRWLDSPVDMGVIQLRVAYNPGVAFSLGATLPAWLIAALTGAITVAILGYIWWAGWKQSPGMRWAVIAIVAGAVANFLDRLPDGVVTDYLHTGWFPTFNLPDVLISVGVVLYVISSLRDGTHGTAPTPAARRSSE